MDRPADRLAVIERKLKNARVYYSRYSPSAAFMYDVENAEEDVRWLIYEVARLRTRIRELESAGGAPHRPS